MHRGDGMDRAAGMVERPGGIPLLRAALAVPGATLATMLLVAPSLHAQVVEDGCAACHRRLEDESLSRPATLFETDIHATKGFGCVACHGGDGTAAGPDAMAIAKDPEKGYIGRPAPQMTAQVCGRCHSDVQFMKQFNPSPRVDQVVEYATSVHGRRLAEFDDPNVATCASCHRVHAIRPPSDPTSSVHPLQVAETCGACHADRDRMEPYGIPTNQLERYSESVHWNALSVEGDIGAPTCNDCHGNHGAAPPGIAWVGNVCGQCHAVVAELFDASFHSELLSDLGTPGCATCHGNHAIRHPTDDFLGMGEASICADCHLDDDEGGETAIAMRGLIDSLIVAYEAADSILEEAENAGMEVSEARFELSDALNALVRARTAVHDFSADAVSEEVESGLEVAVRAYGRGFGALRELTFRRRGLAVSAAIILTLIVGIVLTIQATEERVSAGVDSITGFFFESMVAAKERADIPASPEEIRLAACAVLIELAHADARFTDSELAHVEDLIRRTFDLDRTQAERLIELAEQQRAQGKHIARFTSLISRTYTTEQKLALVKDMWSLGLADGRLASQEQYVIHRIARLLGLDADAVAAAREELRETLARSGGPENAD